MTVPEVLAALRRLHDLTNEEGKRELAVIEKAVTEWYPAPAVPIEPPEPLTPTKEPEPKEPAKAAKEKPAKFKSGGRFAGK